MARRAARQAKAAGYSFEAGTLSWSGTNTFSGNSAQDGTTNPTDDGDIYGATVNGAAVVFNITSAILQSSGGLAQVFATAPAGSTVEFDPSLSGTTIGITTELQINGNLTIDGTLGGAKNIVLAASGSPAPRLHYGWYCRYPQPHLIRRRRDAGRGLRLRRNHQRRRYLHPERNRADFEHHLPEQR